MTKYYTAVQVAEMFQVHEKTVRLMALRGELEGIRLGGPLSALRFSEAALNRWEKSRRKACS